MTTMTQKRYPHSSTSDDNNNYGGAVTTMVQFVIYIRSTNSVRDWGEEAAENVTGYADIPFAVFVWVLSSSY